MLRWELLLRRECPQHVLPTLLSHGKFDYLTIKPRARQAQVSEGWGCSPLLVSEIRGDL